MTGNTSKNKIEDLNFEDVPKKEDPEKYKEKPVTELGWKMQKWVPEKELRLVKSKELIRAEEQVKITKEKLADINADLVKMEKGGFKGSPESEPLARNLKRAYETNLEQEKKKVQQLLDEVEAKLVKEKSKEEIESAGIPTKELSYTIREITRKVRNLSTQDLENIRKNGKEMFTGKSRDWEIVRSFLDKILPGQEEVTSEGKVKFDTAISEWEEYTKHPESKGLYNFGMNSLAVLAQTMEIGGKNKTFVKPLPKEEEKQEEPIAVNEPETVEQIIIEKVAEETEQQKDLEEKTLPEKIAGIEDRRKKLLEDQKTFFNSEYNKTKEEDRPATLKRLLQKINTQYDMELAMLEQEGRMSDRHKLSLYDIREVKNPSGNITYYGYHISPKVDIAGKTMEDLLTGDPTTFRELKELGAEKRYRVIQLLREEYAKDADKKAETISREKIIVPSTNEPVEEKTERITLTEENKKLIESQIKSYLKPLFIGGTRGIEFDKDGLMGKTEEEKQNIEIITREKDCKIVIKLWAPSDNFKLSVEIVLVKKGNRISIERPRYDGSSLLERIVRPEIEKLTENLATLLNEKNI